MLIGGGRPRPIGAQSRDPRWYRDAVIYELRVGSFADGNADGLGDFTGLRERLPYLADLGVTAVWLLPFYPSPGRDDGYDISDYTDVHPDLGSLEDFKAFLDEAHARGLRVITELVLNHTSDQHPWFQRARRAPPGSPERDFYVWSDTPQKYLDARIIFRDFEASNWTWDPVARAYFWHRFYSHQPDLNFENPMVRQAMFAALDFWLGLGVDGLRLDAVPYLFEREGTNCENLEETHAFLRSVRRHVDERYADRMLLAEANQWPEDAAKYFGNGDECHMNFHFPIMPRLFMSIHMEDRFPILDIIAQTPQLPEGAQWALFLRNHDELTLEMVTEDERDYMYRAYAHDPTMRLNLGIRRRLAPLVDNDRRRMELMNGLLLSLPGTPVLYYGDELGMGDNVYLGDRNGVRTPMQWSPDRNAGFSRANPQRLVLPIIIDPSYHYEAVNVEVQQGQPNSMLWWTKRLLAHRRRFKAFGRGGIEFLLPDNSRVLAFLRQWEDEVILVVANLSRFMQGVELDLSRFEGLVVRELFGGSLLGPLQKQTPLHLTLGGHAFQWFEIGRPRGEREEVSEWSAPQVELPEKLDLAGLSSLTSLLASWMLTRGWLDAASGAVESVEIEEIWELGAGTVLSVVRVAFSLGEAQSYFLPLAISSGTQAGELRQKSPRALLAFDESEGRALHEAFHEGEACEPMRRLFEGQRRLRGLRGGELMSRGSLPECSGPLRLVRADKGELNVVVGDTLLWRLYRRLSEGTTPEVELGEALAGRVEPGIVPGLFGSLFWRRGRQAPVSLAVVREWVQAEGTAHGLAVNELRRFLERAVVGEGAPPPAVGSLLERAGRGVPEPVALMVGSMLDWAGLLGRRTAGLHRALFSLGEGPELAPEPYGALDRRSAYQSLRNLLGTTLRRLRSELRKLPPEAIDDARIVLAGEAAFHARFEYLLTRPLSSRRCRHHGRLHLGVILHTGRDFVITGLDGDPTRPLPERRRKRSPLRDVASLIWSLQTVATRTFLDEEMVRGADRAVLAPWVQAWKQWTSATLLGAYLDDSAELGFLPQSNEELALQLERFLIECALSGLAEELAGGGADVRIALHELVEMLTGKP